MYAEKCLFTCKLLPAVLCAGLTALCIPWHEPVSPASVQFVVFDVGEGLAQAVVSDGNAVLFDMGGYEASSGWKSQYDALGKPFVKAIALSHDHLDHRGGLMSLDSTFPWSGLLIVNAFIDTSLIRNSMQYWRNRIRFRYVAEYDTLELIRDVELRCLWPPDTSGDSLFTIDSLKNRKSMVFMASWGFSRTLITSDIDTSAERVLSLRYNGELDASLFIVPHHGSVSSLAPVFYGHINPETAVISCGADNPYGHPSENVLLWLGQMGTDVRLTYLNGPVVFSSKGYSWEEQLFYSDN